SICSAPCMEEKASMTHSQQSNELTGSAYTLEQLLKVALLDQKLAEARQAGNRAGEMQLLNEIGLIFEKIRNGPQALTYHQQALAVAREIGQRNSEGTVLRNMAAVSVYVTGDLTAGLEHLRRSLAIWQELGDKPEEAETRKALLMALLRQ